MWKRIPSGSQLVCFDTTVTQESTQTSTNSFNSFLIILMWIFLFVFKGLSTLTFYFTLLEKWQPILKHGCAITKERAGIPLDIWLIVVFETEKTVKFKNRYLRGWMSLEVVLGYEDFVYFDDIEYHHTKLVTNW